MKGAFLLALLVVHLALSAPNLEPVYTPPPPVTIVAQGRHLRGPIGAMVAVPRFRRCLRCLPAPPVYVAPPTKPAPKPPPPPPPAPKPAPKPPPPPPPAPKPAPKPPPPPPKPKPAEPDWGVWDRLAQCESSGNWSCNTGNGYYGGLQFSLSSWRWVGGSGYPHQASRAEQIRRAERLLALQGWRAWPACRLKPGLR
jgi:hypothetical protein